MDPFKLVKLKNGARVVFVPHRDTAAVTLLVLYEVGSRYETAAENGASHFIEHLMFKGTARRPRTIDISRDLDSVGADYNAFTGKDHTGYYIKLQADKLELAADMLEDMLYHSLYRPADVDSERRVIFEEIRMYEDNPMMFVEEAMEQELYRGSPLARRISGTIETMTGIGRRRLVSYRDRYYVPSRLVIAVAGKFDEAAALQLIERKFGGRHGRPGARPFQKFVVARAGYRAPRVRVIRKETEQVQLALGFPAYPYGHERLAALNLMSSILGGTMSSRLFTTVREKHGLCYFIRAGLNPYQDTGNLTIQAGLAKDSLREAIRLILGELRRIRNGLVAAEELLRAKDNLKGRMILSLEDSSHLADWYAKQELMQHRAETPEQKLKKVFAVTRQEVRQVANDVLRVPRLTMAVIGPYDRGDQFFDASRKF